MPQLMPTEERMVTISLAVPQDLNERLYELSREQRRSKSDLIREAVKKSLAAPRD